MLAGESSRCCRLPPKWGDITGMMGVKQVTETDTAAAAARTNVKRSEDESRQQQHRIRVIVMILLFENVATVNYVVCE